MNLGRNSSIFLKRASFLGRGILKLGFWEGLVSSPETMKSMFFSIGAPL
jgi:hypothetical protein